MGRKQEEKLLESAENIVDAEDELRDRKIEAIKRASEAAPDDDPGIDRGSLLVSPPVQGTSDIREQEFGQDQIDIHLLEELPNGTDTFTISVPDSRSITDDCHRFNRLLSHYGIEPDQLADLNGRRLPLRPIGKYDDPERMDFAIDCPPVPTLPNRLLYRCRRLGERLGLLRWGHTPKIKRSITGSVTGIKRRSSPTAKPMPKSAEVFVRTFGIIDEETETVVPTDRGVGVFLLATFVCLASAVIAVGSVGGALLGLVAMVFLLPLILVWGLIAVIAVSVWGSAAYRWAKRRFFPSP